MSRMSRYTACGFLVALMLPLAATAQFNSEVVGFNDNPDDPASQEMFQDPDTSGTTDQFIVPGDPNSGAFRTSAFPTEGIGALTVFYDWLDASDPNAWVRLTTFNGDIRPNPAVHTGGKVRFKVTNTGDFTGPGEIGLALGIRETGNAVPLLKDGGTAGEIEWVGVDETVNGITAGPDGIVDTVAAGDDVQAVPVGTDLNDPNNPLPLGTAVIEPGNNGVIDTVPANDDAERFGYYIGGSGGPVPIPAITLPVSIFPYTLEWDLATGDVTINGSPVAAGIAGFTGDGAFQVDYGTLEHLALTNVTADTATLITIHIDEMQFEAPVPDPVPAPTIVSPIIAGDTEVTVTDLVGTVDQVTLYRDGGSPISITSGLPAEEVVFNIAAAQTGEVFTATQRSGQAGTVSPFSVGVEVLPEPPVFTFSVLLDEGGTGSCDFTTGGWEWVGATASNGYAPTGLPLFVNNAMWQTIDIPFDDPDLIQPGLGGDGGLEASPNGVYTMDSWWFTAVDPATAVGDPNEPFTWEVYIDAVQVLDANGLPAEVILDMEDGVNRLQNPRGQSPDSPTSSALSANAFYDGGTSHRLEWSYNGTAPDSIGMLQRIGYTCATSALIPDDATGVRFRLLARAEQENPAVPLPVVVGPIIVGSQDTVRVLTDPAATSVQLFINGVAASGLITPTGTETDFSGLALLPGDSVSAKQTLPTDGTSDFAYPKAATDSVPAPGIVGLPLPGQTSVTVDGLVYVPFAEADPVTVIVRDDQGGLIATFDATPSGTSVEVPTSALQGGWIITATQTVNGVVSPESAPVPVQLNTPVIHHPPAAGDTDVLVLNALDGATMTVVLRDAGGQEVNTFNATPTPGDGFVFVPVSGLVAGYSVAAAQTLGGDMSPESDPETVTVAVSTPFFLDDFEAYANQDDFENEFDNGNAVPRDVGWWPSSDGPGLNLVTDQNTTIGGSQSVYAPAGPSGPNAFLDGYQSNHDLAYRITPQAPVASTDTEIISWSVAIYDAAGPGVDNVRQWSEFRDYTDGLGGLIAMGMPGSSFFGDVDNNYYQARVLFGCGPGYINLDQYEAPQRSIGWHMFTAVIKPTEILFYVDGLLSAKACRVDIVYDNFYVGSGYAAVAEGWYDDYRVTTGKVVFYDIAPQPPTIPALVPAVEAGDATVTVTGVVDSATAVTVYANGSQIGSVDPAGADTVDVPVTPLIHLDTITATQTNATGESPASPSLEVGIGNGDLLVSLGVRETGDAGTLGLPGGTSGSLEWIGASSVASGAPQGKPLSPGNTWQTLTFDPLVDPIAGFTGDGVIDVTFGVLEHLAVAVDAASPDRSTGAYRLFVDNVVNVGADNGADFVVSDFETFPLGDEVLFNEPGFSGSTDPLLAEPPDFSVTTDIYGNPGQAQFMSWFWNDTAESSWARITSTGVANTPRPIIDLTKPIRMDLLLVQDCDTKGDLDGDGDIDIDDFNAFVACLAGAQVPTDPTCICSDFNGDGRVDTNDIAAFQAAFTD